MNGRASYRRVDDTAANPGGVRGWLQKPQKPLFWCGVVGLAYFLFTVAVTGIEVFSEMSKLSRGGYSNTFSPFLGTHLLTFPTSLVHSDWPGYSEVFNEARWKSIVWHALPSVMVTVVIQTMLVVAVVWLLVSLVRWVRPRPWTT